MRVITTSSVTTNEALYHLMRVTGLYMIASLDDEPERSIKVLIEAMPKIKPLIKPLGMTAADANQFVRQMRFWLDGNLDWENETHSRRFESAVETFFLYVQEVLVDMQPDELDESQQTLRDSFESGEHALLRAMLGYILNLSRRYATKKFTDQTLKACAAVFREDKEVYWQYIQEEEALAEDGYEKPADYKNQCDMLRNIISRNNVETCEGDDLLATFKGFKKLQEANAEEAKQYSKIRTFLNREAYKAIVGQILYDNEGAPTQWSTLHAQLTRSNPVYLPLSKFPNGVWTGLVQVVKNAKGEDALQWLSPFGEVLKQNAPSGNVVMNPNYVEGSTEFVAQYVVPNSQTMTKVYVYTLAAVKSKSAERFNQTRNVITNLDTFRSKWMKDLKAFDTQMEKFYAAILKPRAKAKLPTPEQWKNGILAMICEIGYQAAPRTGEKGTSSLDTNGSRTPTYALTTLKLGHLVLDRADLHPAIWGSKEDDGIYSYSASEIDAVAFKYKGKAAEPQFHEFSRNGVVTDGDTVARKLLFSLLSKYIANLARAYADLGHNALDKNAILRQPLFRVPNVRASQEAPVNEWSIVLNRHVNGYLKKRVKFDGTFKMFRKLKATKEFMDYMESVKSTLAADNIESHVLHAAGLAGKALGHAAAKRKATGTMALQYYIEARTVLDYYTLLNVNPSKRVANLIKDNIADSKA